MYGVKMPALIISHLAREAGVNVETIRFYQRRGLLPEPDKPLGGIRRYGRTDVARVPHTSLCLIRLSQCMPWTPSTLIMVLIWLPPRSTWRPSPILG
jgi:hypothetical protein